MAAAQTAEKGDDDRSGAGSERRPGGADFFVCRRAAVRPSVDDRRAAAAGKSVTGIRAGNAAGRDAAGGDVEVAGRVAATDRSGLCDRAGTGVAFAAVHTGGRRSCTGVVSGVLRALCRVSVCDSTIHSCQGAVVRGSAGRAGAVFSGSSTGEGGVAK